MPPLDNAKRERFCREYVIDGNATQAYIRAGYSKTGAEGNAARLIGNDMVQKRIAELRGALNDKLEITAERVLREAARLAFSDPRKFFNADGSLKPITELDDDTAATIGSFEPGKVKLWDKTANITLLGKHLKLFDNPVNEAIEGLAAALDRARTRRLPKVG